MLLKFATQINNMIFEAYQAVVQQTSKHHYIYQDAATYCKLGHVRYSMKLAETDHYPVTREFASDVCSLPTAYDAATYMQFIENWGTVSVLIDKNENSSKFIFKTRVKVTRQVI